MSTPVSATALLLLLLSGLPAEPLEEKNCDKTFRTEDAKSGNFSTPEFPKHYPENRHCEFQFHAAPDEVVHVFWNDFHLEPIVPETQQCLRDYVEVIVTDYQDQQHVSGRYCGNDRPPDFKTMQRHIKIIFHSSFTKHFQGFSGSFEFVKEEAVAPPASTHPVEVMGCGGIVGWTAARGEEHGGVLTSPNYPDAYPPDVDCYWVIRVQPGKQIYIKLLELELAESFAECSRAKVQVVDGYSHYSLLDSTREEELEAEKKLVKFCGEEEYYKEEGAKSYMSDRNRILVRFITTAPPPAAIVQERESFGKPVGFRLVWTEVEGTSVESSGDEDGTCRQFLCRGGAYCIDAGGSICAERRRYCIHRSLVCDGTPHCAESDHSDEMDCYSFEIVAAGASVFLLLVLIILLVVCFQRRRNSKQLRRLRRKNPTDADGVPNGKNRAEKRAEPIAEQKELTALPRNYHGYREAETVGADVLEPFLVPNHLPPPSTPTAEETVWETQKSVDRHQRLGVSESPSWQPEQRQRMVTFTADQPPPVPLKPILKAATRPEEGVVRTRTSVSASSLHLDPTDSSRHLKSVGFAPSNSDSGPFPRKGALAQEDVDRSPSPWHHRARPTEV